MYQSKSSYTGVSPQIVLDSMIVPNAMIGAGGNTIVNAWKGVVTIGAVSLGGVNASAYSVTYPSVPQEVCVKLATGAGINFDVVTIGGTTAKAYGATDIDIGSVTTACKQGAQSNTMVFTSR